MIPRRIIGANQQLFPPDGWDCRQRGTCGALPVRAREEAGHPSMQSAWEPTPDELALLNAGGSVILTVHGGIHPPVALHVEQLIGERGEVTAKAG